MKQRNSTNISCVQYSKLFPFIQIQNRDHIEVNLMCAVTNANNAFI